MIISLTHNPIMTFFCAILIHLLYDFHWQGPFVAEFKGKKLFILFIHALTWAMCVSLVLWFAGIFAWWKFIFLLITHMGIDFWKARLPKDDSWFWALYVDQGAHLITILITVF